MARLFSCGFELNSVTTQVEMTVISDAPTISSSTFRSGAYSMIINGMTSGVNKGLQHVISGSTFFVRFYFRPTTTTPSAENRIFGIETAAYITLDSSNVLRLYDEDGAIGAASSALSANIWYRVEVQFDTSTAAGSHIVNARIDGVQFAGASNRNIATSVGAIKFGANLNAEAQTTGQWFFDDVAINDATGSFQNSWPGDGGIVHMLVDSAGDNNAFTVQVGGTAGASNNFTRIKEVTPDDATSYNGDLVTNNTDDFNLVAAPAEIDSNAIIPVVSVGVRFNAAVAALESAFVVRVKVSASDTVEESSAITPNSTAWVTNAIATPFNQPLTLYNFPGTSNQPWRKTDLGSTQIGYRISTGNTNATNISAIWLMVEYRNRGVGIHNEKKYLRVENGMSRAEEAS